MNSHDTQTLPTPTGELQPDTAVPFTLTAVANSLPKKRPAPRGTALSPEEALIRASTAHEGKGYDWSKFVYTNARQKISVGCPSHGFFESTYDSVQRGFGCRKCGYEKSKRSHTYTTKEFVSKVRAKLLDLNGEEYDYSDVDYSSSRSKVVVTCKIHGEFLMTPSNAINRDAGCPSCGKETAHSPFRKPISTLEEDIAQILPPDKYKLTGHDGYTGNKSWIEMTCSEHGPWKCKANWILCRKTGCPSCSTAGTSAQEQEVIEYVKKVYSGTMIENSRQVIPPLELDIYLPEIKVAIEFNGLFWHSEENGKDWKYHLNKTLECEKRGIKLLHILEDEWVGKRRLVEREILHAIGVVSREAATSAVASPFRQNDFRSFLTLNHLEGYQTGKSSGFVLHKDGEVVAAMSVSEIGTGAGQYEITRFLSEGADRQTAFDRLLVVFLKDNPGASSISFTQDKRWASFTPTGFTRKGTTPPDYDYCNSQVKRVPREDFMKHKMPNLVASKIFKTFDPALTEVENCKANGYWRVWNCGMDLWEYNVPQQESIVKPRPQASLG